MTGTSSVSYHEKKLSAVLQKQSRQLLLWRHRALLAPSGSPNAPGTCLPGPFGPAFPTAYHSPCAGTKFLASQNQIKKITMTNLINIEFNEEDYGTIMEAIAIIVSKMPFLVKLSDDEKKSLMRLEDGRSPFAAKAFDYALRDNSLAPNTALIDAAALDGNLYNKLTTIFKELNRVTEMVRDTRTLAGAEYFDFARLVYKTAKLHVEMGVPGSQTIVDDLGKLFNPRPRPEETQQPS